MSPITWRRKAGPLAGAAMSLVFAAALAAVATAERWTGLDRPLLAGERAPITVRLPVAPATGVVVGAPATGSRVIVARGEVVTAEQANLAATLRSGRPSAGRAMFGLFCVFTLLGVLLTAYLRTGPRGRFLRTQAAVLAAFVLVAAGAKALLLLTPLSAFLIPSAAVALLLAALVDRAAGLGGAIAMGLVISALTPFDAPVAIVLGAQGMGAVLALSRPKRSSSFLLAGLAGGACAGVAYAATFLIHSQLVPWTELRDPMRSALVASITGGLASGALAVIARAFLERLIGDIPRSTLVELADLESALLKKIATEAPGTWQHSLAMANLAETAANAIGANALLVRVGAYYHDLGKTARPELYIENLVPGQPSPHDQLAPERSAEMIFAHVTEGVKLGRAAGLPEPVVDFMHMHHGDGVLEYFWAKCLEQGNPRRLTMDTFRYPGKRPQSRETAILAICDAVEAASRTLRQPDAKSIEALVQRIVYGKLHLGQLDESGLTMSDLKTLANKLTESLKAAHHVRIEYPWQREERAAASLPPTDEETQRFVTQHVLDSADSPRPVWGAPSSSKVETAATRPMRAVIAPESSSPSLEQITRPLGPPPPEPAPAPPPPPAAEEIVLLPEGAPRPPAEDERLTPGTLFLGPPPATHPQTPVSERLVEITDPPAHGDSVPIVVPAVPTQSMTPPRRRPPPPPKASPGADEPLRTGEVPRGDKPT